jgi:hypothetical protein
VALAFLQHYHATADASWLKREGFQVIEGLGAVLGVASPSTIGTPPTARTLYVTRCRPMSTRTGHTITHQ